MKTSFLTFHKTESKTHTLFILCSPTHVLDVLVDLPFGKNLLSSSAMELLDVHTCEAPGFFRILTADTLVQSEKIRRTVQLIQKHESPFFLVYVYLIHVANIVLRLPHSAVSQRLADFGIRITLRPLSLRFTPV